MEAELALPSFPHEVAYVWTAFLRLHNRRGSTGFGPAPITWESIDAFCRHSRMTLAPWEVEIIEALDGAWMGAGVNTASQQD